MKSTPSNTNKCFSIIFSLIIIINYTLSTSPSNTLFMLQWLMPRISVQFLGRIPQPIVESHFLTPVIIAASTKTHLNYSAAWSQCNKSHRRKHTKDTILKASFLPQKILEKNDYSLTWDLKRNSLYKHGNTVMVVWKWAQWTFHKMSSILVSQNKSIHTGWG